MKRSLLIWALSRMSTGSTQSCVSISSTRFSADSGMETMTRSTRVCRANSMRSATRPSLGTLATDSGERSSLRSSNRPSRFTSAPALCRMEAMSASASCPPPTITVRRLSLPSAVQCRTSPRSPSRKAMSSSAPPANHETSHTRDTSSELLSRNAVIITTMNTSAHAASTRPICWSTVR